jgi:hypothetical protein
MDESAAENIVQETVTDNLNPELPVEKLSQNTVNFAYRFNLVVPWAAFFINVAIIVVGAFSNVPIERLNILASILNLGTGSALTYMRR